MSNSTVFTKLNIHRFYRANLLRATFSIRIGQDYHLYNKNGKPATKDELADNYRHDGVW